MSQSNRDTDDTSPNMICNNDNGLMPDEDTLQMWLNLLRQAFQGMQEFPYLFSWSQALDKDLIAERPTLLTRIGVADLQAAFRR